MTNHPDVIGFQTSDSVGLSGIRSVNLALNRFAKVMETKDVWQLESQANDIMKCVPYFVFIVFDIFLCKHLKKTQKSLVQK